MFHKASSKWVVRFLLILVFFFLLCWYGPVVISQYLKKDTLLSLEQQEEKLHFRSKHYTEKGEKLAALKLKLISRLLFEKGKEAELTLSAEMSDVSTAAYPKEYKRTDLIVGEELSVIDEPLLTLLIFKLKELSLEKSLSEIESCGSCVALRALSATKLEKSQKLIYRILDKGENNVLTWEATILAWRMKMPNIGDLLIERVLASKNWGRQYSVFVLGEIRCFKAQSAIIKALSDSSKAVRRHSVLALTKIGDGQSLKLLRKLQIDDPDSIVRTLAAQAVEKIERELPSLEP